jgi:hypothetical protein
MYHRHFRFCQEVVDPAVRVSAEAVDGGESLDLSTCCKCGQPRDLVVTLHGSGSWVLAIASEYGVKVRRARALTFPTPTIDDERATATRHVPLCKQCAPQHWVREHERRPHRIVAVERGTEESYAEGLVTDGKNRQTLAAGGKWYGAFYTNGQQETVRKGVFATRREAEEALTGDTPGWTLRCVRELPPDGVVESWPDDEEARQR